MAGLLSGFEDPQTVGLLSAAAQMLAASGPSRTPTSFGQVLGGGLLGGMQGMQQAQDRQRENKLYDFKIKQMESALADDELKRADAQKVRDFYGNINQFMPSQSSQAMAANAAGGRVGPTGQFQPEQMPTGQINAQAMYRAMLNSGSPTLAQAGLAGMTKEDEAFTLKPGESRMRGNKVIASLPEKLDLPAAIKEYQFAVGQGYKGTFDQWDIARKRATATSVNVTNAGPRAFETELGKLDAEQLKTLRDGAQTASSVLGTVKNLRTADASGAYAGGGANAKTTVGNFVYGLTGTEPKGLFGSQVYNAEASKLILDRVKALGANPSNADREFIEKTVPQLSMSKRARDQLTDWMEQKATQQIDLYKRADAHARKNHGLGGFDMIGDVDAAADALVRKYSNGGQ